MAELEELLPDIERIARNVSSDYPDIDWRDISQHLCVFILEKGDQLVWEGNGGSVLGILKKVSQQYCKDERTQQNYLSAQYSYRPSDVIKILESGFVKVVIDEKTRESILNNSHVPEDAVSIDNSSVDALDVASDVVDAYERLSLEYRNSLFKRYALGEIPVHASYERKKLNKAVKELTRILNSYKGKQLPTRRRVVSNSTATAMISKGY